MRICVVGTGYVGLVTGACLADVGNTVTCVDKDASKVEAVNAGRSPIYEEGLDDVIARNIKAHRLSATTDLATAVNASELCFIAVGTPSQDDGTVDLGFINDVANEIGDVLDHEMVIVVKSTVPVGTTNEVGRIIRERLTARGRPVSFAKISFNPEFLKEGTSVVDFMKPDRIIVGVEDESLLDVFNKLYEPFMHKRSRLITMDIASAELTKYAANSMLASRISFMNSLAILAEKVGANINNVRIGIGYDPRIGPDFLYAGIGYGGSCFPKDVKGLLKTAEANDVKLPIVEQTHRINNDIAEHFFGKIKRHFNGKLKDRTFAIWGLSFKPKTDDMRDAPAVKLINELLHNGARVKAYDPVAVPNARKIFGDRVEFFDSSFDCLANSDALVLVTEWQEFKSPDFDAIKKAMKTPVIFDGRNIYCAFDLNDSGFDYYGVGFGA